MDADEFRKAAHAAIEEIIEYNQNITSYPVLPTIKPGFLAPQLPQSAPQKPQPWSEIQPDIASKIMPGLTHWQSPNFLAFFPAGVTYPSILGEMYSAAFTAPAFNWLCSPSCTELETVVMDWLAQAFDLPREFHSDSPTGGGGVIQGSASEALVTCMVAARERYLHAKCDAEGLANPSAEREDRIASLRGRLVALSSDQAHSSTQKGANICGTRYRSIPTSFDDDLALRPADVEAAIEQALADGLEPFYITLTLGTTSTCATDPFSDLHPLFRDKHPDIWVHVDAAYAGTALVCPEYSGPISPTLAIGDSFNTNLHKWLLVSFDASCLWVRNRNHLTAALSINAAYYQNTLSDKGLVTDYRDWQIPLGRRFRALKIWFVMRSYGVEGMRHHIRRTVALGDLFAALVHTRAAGLFELIAPPAFGLTCFRIAPAAVPSSFLDQANGVCSATPAPAPDTVDNEATTDSASATMTRREDLANTLTKKVADTVNEQGEIFLTASSTRGRTFMRVVSGNPNAEEKYVRNAFEVILKVTAEVLGGNTALKN